ncbi:AraC family transcriptional regulator [Paenibacillus aurantiacus]|uniref:AraC family transcriptional regulator n=1 Tax=Paenibacillus aurantiacus TaxID=1936118 RepID=A0ABV5KKR5_9BACL
MIEYLSPSKQHTELYLTQYGMEDCLPGHFFGPAVRTHYLLHYILEGEGIFEVGGKKYKLRKGQGFLICPGVITYYQADTVNPWTYCWIGFNGTLAESLLRNAGFSITSPILCYERDDAIYELIMSMSQSQSYRHARETRLTGLLYSMLAMLMEFSPNKLPTPPESRAEIYVEQVQLFIENNYAQKITVGDIARVIGLNRSYLCSLFHQRMNMSIQDYLIRYRMNKACEMMGNVELSIGDISRSVGYHDPLLFSKMFKKVKGDSPRHYRALSQASSSIDSN